MVRSATVGELGDTMPAAVYQGNRTITVERLPVPDVGPDDVLLEVSHCGVCGSDLHMYWEDWGRPGSTGGHEWSGTVVAVGGNVGEWRPGDRAVGGPDRGCHQSDCDPCAHGRTHLCRHKDKAGVTPHQGAFAAYKRADTNSLYRIPDGLDLRTASLTEPLAVAYHGVLAGRAKATAPITRALVTGAGPIGLLTIAVLRELGINDITVSEPAPKRRDRAHEVGATSVVSPDQLPPTPELPMDVVDRPFQLAVDCSGRSDAMEAALGQLDRAGVLVLSGTGLKRPRLDSNRIILNELTITGSIEYTPQDYEDCLQMLAAGDLPVDLLIEPDDVPLSGMQDALGQLFAGELPGKVLIVPKEA